MKKKYGVAIISFGIIIAFIIIVGAKYIKYDDDWAFFNYGQTVNEKKGIPGIDIGIVNYNCKTIREKLPGIKVAVVDSGVYNKRDSVHSNNLEEGWDFYNSDKSTYDAYAFDYHGTYIANKICEICSSCKILPVKVLSGTRGYSKDCVAGLRYAIENGAKIVNCSWNFEEKSIEMENLMRDNKDILFITSAGNKKCNLNLSELYPCSYDLENLIVVGAMDSKGCITDFSGYGKSVDVFAPGENVKVMLPENDVGFIDGTSISTAFVTGIATKIMAVYPNLTASDVKKTIVNSAIKVDSLEKMCASGGFVNIEESIELGGKYAEQSS